MILMELDTAAMLRLRQEGNWREIKKKDVLAFVPTSVYQLISTTKY
jgi:hypothetical protein